MLSYTNCNLALVLVPTVAFVATILDILHGYMRVSGQYDGASQATTYLVTGLLIQMFTRMLLITSGFFPATLSHLESVSQES